MKFPEYSSHNFIQFFKKSDHISQESIPVDGRPRARPFSR